MARALARNKLHMIFTQEYFMNQEENWNKGKYFQTPTYLYNIIKYLQTLVTVKLYQEFENKWISVETVCFVKTLLLLLLSLLLFFY